MHIKKNMINSELRKIGSAIRFILPYFKKKTFHKCNFLLKKFMVGKCSSKNVQYEQKEIPRADGSKLRICIYKPLEIKIHVPGLLWLHGGGLAIGAPEQDLMYIERFIKASDCIVVAPDYRLSVDLPYPAAIDDCYTALVWMKDHCKDLGIASNQLMVAGNSAGGGLTSALSLMARDKGDVALAYQMPLYPMLDDRMITDSSKDNDAPIWNSKSNEIGWNLYLGDSFGTNQVSKYAAPSRETDYSNLPPTCTFVGTIEPFHDETVTYVEALRKNGIHVDFKEYEGCFHAFDLVGAKTTVGKDAAAFLMKSFCYAVEHYFEEQL